MVLAIDEGQIPTVQRRREEKDLVEKGKGPNVLNEKEK